MKNLFAVLLLLITTSCGLFGWKGSPQEPADELYRTCIANCPGGICARENGKWVCVKQ